MTALFAWVFLLFGWFGVFFIWILGFLYLWEEPDRSPLPTCWIAEDSNEINVLLLPKAKETAPLSLSLCVMYSIPLFILVTFHQPCSNISISSLYWGVRNVSLL